MVVCNSESVCVEVLGANEVLQGHADEAAVVEQVSILTVEITVFRHQL